MPFLEGKFTVDVAAVKAALSADTIMIYSSAPGFPQGVIDPIAELAAVARRAGVGLHVDCCLGGFVLPFARALGGTYAAALPEGGFDFGVPGVTTMSCDTHKCVRHRVRLGSSRCIPPAPPLLFPLARAHAPLAERRTPLLSQPPRVMTLSLSLAHARPRRALTEMRIPLPLRII